MSTAIMWFRRDLRLRDNPALLEAARSNKVLALVVLDERLLKTSAIRSQRFLASVRALQESLDGRLIVRTGDPERVVPQMAADVDADGVHISRETEPFGRERDSRVLAALQRQGCDLIETGTPYAVAPGRVVTKAGTPFQVFGAFQRAWLAHGWPSPAPLPGRLNLITGVESEVLPTISQPDRPSHEVGESGAQQRWDHFVDQHLAGYTHDRNRPDLDTTSRLSAALKFGEIHPRSLLQDLAACRKALPDDTERFVAELCWREFYADVLWHRPDTAWKDYRTALAAMVYDDPATCPQARRRFEAWQQGRTGFPLVDAGMRQMLAEGWMHNRVRMVCASFLTKDLHIWWPHGARYFMEHLIDGDMASNSHGWQWVAGTGTDAAPYFRVFNPIQQSRTWDPNGDYIRRWIPELAGIQGKAVHEPWDSLGTADYPEPIVDHAAERVEALARYAATREP